MKVWWKLEPQGLGYKYWLYNDQGGSKEANAYEEELIGEISELRNRLGLVLDQVRDLIK